MSNTNETKETLKAAIQQLRAGEQQLRAANKQLRENEKDLRLKNIVFESSIAANSIANNDGIITNTNQAFLNIWGYGSKEEVIEKSISYFMKNENEALEIITSLNQTGKWDGEYTGLKKDGSQFIAWGLATVIQSAKGENLGYQSAVIDITGRKQAEEKLKITNQQLDASNQQLRASEQQLRAANQQLEANNQQLIATEQQLRATNQQLIASENSLKIEKEFSENLLETANTFILTLDKHANITLFNKFAEKLTGRKKENVLGKNWFDLFISEQNGNTIPTVFQNVLKGMPEFSSYENFILCEDGSEKLISWKNTVLKDGNGKISGILSIGSDITERKQMEEILEENEKQLQTLLNTMPDFICFKDGNGRWIKVNDASIRIFQLEDVDYQGKKDSELAELNSKLRGTFLTCKETDARAWKEGGLIRAEETIPDANGSIRIYEVTKVSVSHSNEKRKGLVVIGHDITERKQAEKNIIKLSTAVEQSPSVIVIADLDGKIEYVNLKFTELTGYSTKEAIGEKPRILKSGELPDEIYKELWETISSGKEWHGEFHNKKKNGKFFWEAASISPIFDKQGKITGYLKVAENITERKQIEEKLKNNEYFLNSVLESVQNGISVLNPDLTIRHVNGIMNNWYKKNLPLKGKKCYEAYHNADKPCDPCPTLRCLKSGKTEWNIVPGLPGSPVKWVELFSYPIKDQNSGKITGVVEFVRDITERKQTEEKLKKRMNELEIFNDASVNREIKINELRKEINELLEKTGEKAKYEIIE